MKNIFLVSALFLLVAGCANEDKKPVAATQNDSVKTDVAATNANTGLMEALKDVVPKDTIRNGEYIERYKSGVMKFRGMMKDGKREGLWESFYDNGARWSQTTFKNGIKNGPTTTWYDNEKKRYEGVYTNDEETGNWKYWDEKGKLLTEKDYDKK